VLTFPAQAIQQDILPKDGDSDPPPTPLNFILDH